MIRRQQVGFYVPKCGLRLLQRVIAQDAPSKPCFERTHPTQKDGQRLSIYHLIDIGEAVHQGHHRRGIVVVASMPLAMMRDVRAVASILPVCPVSRASAVQLVNAMFIDRNVAVDQARGLDVEVKDAKGIQASQRVSNCSPWIWTPHPRIPRMTADIERHILRLEIVWMVAVEALSGGGPLHKVAHPPLEPIIVLSNSILGDISIIILPSSRMPSCSATKGEVSAPGYRSMAARIFPGSVVFALGVQTPHMRPRGSEEGKMLVPTTMVDIKRQGVLQAGN